MTWQQLIGSPEWGATIASPFRQIRHRAELVDATGMPIREFPLVSGDVSWKAGAAERWAASLTITDHTLVPVDIDAPLYPWSRVDLRIWWGILIDGVWQEMPVCTLQPASPDVDDQGGTLTITVTGRDVLADPATRGYSGTTIAVGGSSTLDALTAILDVAAPSRARVFLANPTITLPAHMVLGERSPQTDWTMIAALEGWTVRSDRLGRIIIGPESIAARLAGDWQEGPSGQVTAYRRQISTDIINRVRCTSSHPDLITPVSGYAEDDDESSPTFVGRYGVSLKDITSDVAVTEAACAAAAATELRRLMRPLETLTVTARQRPDLDADTLLNITRRRVGVAGTMSVDSWRMPLGSPDPMQVTLGVRRP